MWAPCFGNEGLVAPGVDESWVVVWLSEESHLVVFFVVFDFNWWVFCKLLQMLEGGWGQEIAVGSYSFCYCGYCWS